MKTDRTYAEIKEQCLRERRLFEDPDFPANNKSVFPSKRPPKPFEWKRPAELTSDPQLFVEGASRLDIKQGNLGDCWLLAAMSSLCQCPGLLHRVVPQSEQGFSEHSGYCGVFHFNFWVFGKWTEVVIDDRLPTQNGRLVFMHSPQKNEFWAALLEKAYAKLHGCYENLKGGSSCEAMEDFTGGITELFDLMEKPPANLFSIMMKSVEHDALMGCSIDVPRGMERDWELTNGLIVGHAYSVTDAKTLELHANKEKRTIQLVRLRNPWGNEREWNGAWSDKSKEWSMIPPRERERVGLVISDDGEFWMSFKDFVANFSKLEICSLGPDTVTGDSSKRYEMTSHQGSWRRRLNAGGCLNNRNTFWTNPQFRVTVIDADEYDDDDTGSLIIALLQKERRSVGSELLTIGYAIYKLNSSKGGLLDREFFRRNKAVARCPQFIDMREVTGRHKLTPGDYCVIPSTFDPGEEGDFLLRVFTEQPIHLSENDEETKIGQPPRLKRSSEQLIADAEAQKTIKELFLRLAGNDLEVDAYELKDMLNAVFMKEFKFGGFSSDACRSLVAMKDDDHSGKLNYDECMKLYYDILLWAAVFRKHDEDGSGNFNSYELRAALNVIGVSVSNATFNSLVQRYSNRDGVIEFDDYIQCIARLCSTFDTFEAASRGNTTAVFSLDAFVSSTMYS